MQGDTIVLIILAVFALAAVSGWINIALSLSWNRSYFTKVLPVRVWTVPVAYFHNNVPSVQRLEKEFRSEWIGSLVFREVSPDIYAVRGKVFDLSLTNLGKFQGTLSFDRTKHCVSFQCFVHWWDLAGAPAVGLLVTAVLAQFAYGMWMLGLLQVCAVILFLSPPYFIIGTRIQRLVRFAAAAWYRTYRAPLLPGVQDDLIE